MDNRELLYKEIKAAFQERVFAAAEGYTKEKIQEISPRINKAANELMNFAEADGRFDSKNIVYVWKKYFSMTRKVPVDGWQQHVYLYVRNQMFPHLPGPEDEEQFARLRASLMQFMRGVYEYERKVLKFNPRMDFDLLSDAEIQSEGFIPEYIKMHKLIKSKYIYEFMRIGIDTTPFNTLGHVAGVHYVAMYAARQLYKVGIPVDLGLISAAAASHDIGKYGCRKHEERRIPYLHYYYTDYCLNRFQLPTVAHIAANHSTWDLELENLSVESLLLIYADFRVKSTREDGIEIIHFYTLDDAFDVILGKLDNVDEAKKHRYTKVYNKLKDFEDYMLEHGVHTDIPEDLPKERPDKPVPFKREPVMMHGQDVIEQLKYKAVDHNIRLMSKFNSIEEFGTLLEVARSENNWKSLRTYITILDEYSTYMTDEQKRMTLSFLYEALSHHESDIREQAARLMGKVIGKYREEYKKELPSDIPESDKNVTNLMMFEEYIEKVIHPDYKYTEQHKKWITANTDFIVSSVLMHCRENCRHKYIEILEKYYHEDASSYDEEMVIVLSSTAILMPRDAITDSFRETFLDFSNMMYGTISVSDDLIMLHAREHLFGKTFDTEAKRRALAGLDVNTPIIEKLSSMFLDDLKANTPWTVKVTNIHYMLDEVVAGNIDSNRLLHVATHLANLIKVSETVTARRTAGDALLQILEYMSTDQINELLIELHNGLEIDDYQFSRFIPNYLGIVMLHLPPMELDETIDELEKVINTGAERTSASALVTLAIALEHYKDYALDNNEEIKNARMLRLIGLLMKGFAYYNKLISHEAFTTLGEHIFASDYLSLEDKHVITSHCMKKILTILDRESESNELDFYNNAAVLNQLYRYISEYESEVGKMQLCEREKVAFFPGTFDPFSLGHKSIATTIRDMGFEVYLAIDEFSWSKKTLPHMLRKNILGMSIADEEHLYIFPDDVSVNIANPNDLKILREMFAGKEPYIAVGTDVVKNASSYKKAPEENSIHTFNHIVFARETKNMDAPGGKSYPIKADVVNLTLKKFYEDISSTKIRHNIDLGRDISQLIDPIVQNYIYDNNFYSREPAYKHVLQAQELSISNYNRANVTRLFELDGELASRGYDLDKFHAHLENTKLKTLFIESGTRSRKISAFACARRIESHELIGEFGNVTVAKNIRDNSAGGGIALISAFYASKGRTITNLNQILLTELMTALLAKDYGYAVYHPIEEKTPTAATIEVLKRQGFVNISPDHNNPVYAANLRAPIVIFRDVETVIKAPLNKNPRVIKALDDAHNKLLKTFTELYPGKLLITFNTSAVYSKIVDLVAKENGVPNTPTPDKIRGPYLSVPFGKALSDVVVPNTVTKALRTEKYFRNDLHGFTIRESKNQATLRDQARVLKSFDRPVILIDDLLHKGQRMNIIDPILRAQEVDVHKVIVGLLTGNAQDNMAIKNRAVEGAYFIPTIAMWLNERDCYPFIGGDSIDSASGEYTASINFLLPYTAFSFVGKDDPEAIYKYSMTCLENTASILKVLEQEYQDTFGRKLTLKRLGDVITNPGKPLIGEGLHYDEHVAPSTYVENDIRKANRLNHFKK